MMNDCWLMWVDGADGLNALYPDGLPSDDRVDLHAIELHRDGPRLALRFDLSRYPEKPPEKWHRAGYDTVQVVLMGIGVRGLQLNGWEIDNIGHLSIAGRPGGRHIEFRNDAVALSADVLAVQVQKISAYTRSGPT